MLNSYNEIYDQKIALNRTLFLKGERTLPEAMRAEISDSWLRCEKTGLNPVSQLKKSDLIDKDKPISKYIREHVLINEVNALYNLLDELHGAIFYTNFDSDIIFSQRGNETLLKYLSSKSLGISTYMLEENLGTTALVIPPSECNDAWAIGAEHYHDIFLPFVTYVYKGEYYGGLKINSFIILPKEHFNNLFIYYIREYNKNCKTLISSYMNSLNFELKEVLFKQYEQNNDYGIILLDPLGKILSINEKIARWFQLNIEDIRERNCAEIFPELKHVLYNSKTGEDIHLEEVQMKSLPVHMQYMRIDVKPIFGEQNEIIGFIVSFYDKKRISHTVNKLSHSQAYYGFDHILGKSNAIREAKQKAITAAQSKSPVILTGESGTGKELFAQAIHNASTVQDGPFVALNCAAIVPELIASELFGYVDGAFTGSRKGGSMGKFEYAHKGTLFLDEIGDLSLSVQAILLRVLEEKRISRIGSNIEIPVDVRLITATNKDLRKMVKERTFRLDLYYRIFVVNINLPALKDRISDIPILANSFVDYYNSIFTKNIKKIDNEALSYLVTYRWPGNVRELRNVIECGMNNSQGEVLKLNDFPDFSEYSCEDATIATVQTKKLEDEFIQNEKQRLLSLMIEYNGNKSKISKRMGISRSTLYKKMNEYDLL